MSEAKASHKQWTAAGRPKGDHALRIKRRRTSKEVRRTTRRNEAENRIKQLDKISNAKESDERLFYSLIRRQRSNTTSCNLRLDDGTVTSDDKEIRTAWTEHFENLATPDSDQTDQEYEMLEMLHQRLEKGLVMGEVRKTTPGEIKEVIKKMKSGKAADQNGLKAEQLKLAPEYLADILCDIMQRILEHKQVPLEMKQGFKIPIPKPGKDPLERNNYRGITITPLFGKILETLILNRVGPTIETIQSELQFGFTKGMSPTMASLCLVETMAEARDTKQDLYVTTLDASKAFDVVDHGKLKVKLYSSGIGGQLWQVVDNLYNNCTEIVRWNGSYGPCYEVKQGVRQGGTMSPTLYKLYVNHLLSSLETASAGCSIGNIFMGTPTCADDVLLLSNSSSEMQGMINVCGEYASRHKYKLHPIKSQVIHQVKTSKQKNAKSHEWTLGTEQITEATDFTHLGLNWAAGKYHPNMDAKVESARKTAYALMGVGLHGINGLDPGTAVHLVKTYILPKLLYGLDSVILRRKDIDELETYYRKLLRQIQGLPDTTANEAVYLLIGALPLEASLHMRLLGVFGNITRLNKGHTLYQLARRQLAVKDQKSHSWFIYISKIAAEYEIDLHQALVYPWKKQHWKSYIKTLIEGCWWDKIKTRATKKSSLSWLNLQECKPNQAHQIWQAAKGNTYRVEAATIRARMLVGKYMLQATRARYNQNAVNPACLLCDGPREDMVHLIAVCPALEQVRQPKKSNLEAMLHREGMCPPDNDHEWCRLILNGGTIHTDTTHGKMTSGLAALQQMCSILCWALHKERDIKLNDQIMQRL